MGGAEALRAAIRVLDAHEKTREAGREIGSPGELAREELDWGRRAEGSITRSWTIGGGSIGRRSAGGAGRGGEEGEKRADV